MLGSIRAQTLIVSVAVAFGGCAKEAAAPEADAEAKAEDAKEAEAEAQAAAAETDRMPIGIDFTADGGPFQNQRITPVRVAPTEARWVYNQGAGTTQLHIKADQGERQMMEVRFTVPAGELGSYVLDGGEAKLVPSAKIVVRNPAGKPLMMTGSEVTIEFTRYEPEPGYLVGRFNGKFAIGQGPPLAQKPPEERDIVTITDGWFKARYRPNAVGRPVPEWASMWGGEIPEWQQRLAEKAAAGEGEEPGDGEGKRRRKPGSRKRGAQGAKKAPGGDPKAKTKAG